MTTLFNKRFLSILITAVLTMLPLHMAFAAGITLSLFSGTPQAITVSGWGFSSGETVDIYFNTTSSTKVASATAAADSQFSTSVNIPVSTPQGPLPIIAVGQSSGMSGSNSFYVISFTPSVNLSYSNNTPGSTVIVNGGGFAPSETVNFFFGAAAAGSAAADSSGNLVNATSTIPFLSPATYQFHAVGASSGADSFNRSYTYFYVGGFYPSAYPSTYYLLPSQTLSFNGSGWSPGETITITESSTSSVLSTITVNSGGSFNNDGNISIPYSFVNSTRSLHLSGDVSLGSVDVSVTIGTFYPHAYPSGYYISPNMPLSFSGGGFGGNETVKVYQGTSPTPLTSFVTETNGTFMNAGLFTVPYTYAGTTRVFRLVGDLSNAETEVPVTIGQFYPNINPSTYFIKPGQQLSVSGSGYAPNEYVDISLSGAPPIKVQADSFGNFNTATGSKITVPFTGFSMLTLSAVGESSKALASVIITIGTFYPSVSPSAYYVFGGETVTFTGYDFAPNEIVDFALATSALNSFTADNLGIINGSFVIGFGQSGSKTYSFTGRSSAAVANLNITVATPYAYAEADNYYALAGSTVNVRGFGFAANEMVTITGGTSTTTVQAGSSGATAWTVVTIPYSQSGSATFVLTGQSSGATASVTVTVAPFSAQVTPSSWYVSPGTPVTFTGSGFAPNEDIAISLNGSSVGSATTTAGGGFTTGGINVPAVSSAKFVFMGDTSGASASVIISVAQLSPSVWLSVYYEQGGKPLTVYGGGFGGNENVHITFDSQDLGDVLTDAGGNFTLATTVPYASAGNKTITATGDKSGVSASASLTMPQVYVNIQLASYAGAPGSPITFIGSGYLPGEPVEITTDRTSSTVVAAFSADASGNFNDSSYVLPTSFVEGPLTFTVTGKYSFTSHSIVYYVTGQ